MGGPGSGGHNRKPTRLHVLEGTYRRDRHGPKNTPKPPPIAPPMPRGLPKEAKAFWKKYAPMCERMGTLDALSGPLFEVLCCTWAQLRDLEAILQRDGLIVTTARGKERPHPLHSALVRTSKDFLKLAAEFGLTPAGRARLGLTWPPEDEDDGPLAHLWKE